MSRIYGDIRQIAFVVRDIDLALRYWTETLGVGPFFVFRRMEPADRNFKSLSPLGRVVSDKVQSVN